VKRYVRAGAGQQYILDHPEKRSRWWRASRPGREGGQAGWRWKIQNPLYTSEDTKKNGLLWMNPPVWDEMMAFYKSTSRFRASCRPTR
jgi:hypothetical protein